MMVLTPKEIVSELDRYIIGQDEAKRAVAIAMRNRYRRQRLPADLREEILPKNILMIGPTGVGKTEIARRLARIAHAPFVKVEATKFTEVGYVGRDVDSIIRELTDVALRMVKAEKIKQVEQKAEDLVEQRLVELLVPGPPPAAPLNPMDLLWGLTQTSETAKTHQEDDDQKLKSEREQIRKLLRLGELEERMVEVVVEKQPASAWDMMTGSGMDDLGANFREMLGDLLPKKTQKRTVTVREAREILLQEEATKLLDMDAVNVETVALVEESGIVFIDEIDKIAGSQKHGGPDVSREGVQRDILPIIEGSTVITKAGPVRTDYILFIAAGAFHVSKPADLIPELQGRFPIRVNLESLRAGDFARILTEPHNSLTRQYTALLGTEGVDLVFTEDGVMAIAEIAEEVNRTTENIGARRLHTILERLLEDVSFESTAGSKVTVDAGFVQEKLGELAQNQDLTRYIL
ncbi:MAG: ATP-dependent protease ATPase subunit HslU [Firmicutes bacterium]|mgnify:CR=1 FL=1|nr:ATP-dependent protease ATPase subunit HslU [Bacillota bacterium]